MTNQPTIATTKQLVFGLIALAILTTGVFATAKVLGETATALLQCHE